MQRKKKVEENMQILKWKKSKLEFYIQLKLSLRSVREIKDFSNEQTQWEFINHKLILQEMLREVLLEEENDIGTKFRHT